MESTPHLFDVFRWVGAGSLWICAVGFGIASSSASWAMIEEVNSHLPRDQRLGYAGWWAGKTLRLRKEYRRLNPSGTLLRKIGVRSILMFACFGGAATLLGFGLLAAFPVAAATVVTWALYLRSET
jgi:hypothetical protein